MRVLCCAVLCVCMCVLCCVCVVGLWVCFVVDLVVFSLFSFFF